MKPIRLLSGAVVAALLAACSHVPVETMWKLRKFDPMTADPATIRAAVAAPALYAPREGGAKMVLTQTRRGGEEVMRLEIVLEEVPVVSETGLARVRPRRGSVLRAYRIGDKDVPRLIEARRQAAERSAKEPGVYAGSFAVGVDGCRVGDVALPEEVRVSTWIKTADTDGYIPLIDDIDLVATVGRDKLLEASPACPAK